DECEHKTLILPLVLRGIEGDLAGSCKDEPFADFVCPRCGYGRRRLVDELLREELESPPPGSILYPTDLFHESLRCGAASCSAHARVHMPGETSTSGTVSKIAASECHGMTGITCSMGHPVPVPVEPMSNVFP